MTCECAATHDTSQGLIKLRSRRSLMARDKTPELKRLSGRVHYAMDNSLPLPAYPDSRWSTIRPCRSAHSGCGPIQPWRGRWLTNHGGYRPEVWKELQTHAPRRCSLPD